MDKNITSHLNHLSNTKQFLFRLLIHDILSFHSFRSKAITFGSMLDIFDVHQSLFAFYRLKMKEKVAAPQKTGKRQIVRKRHKYTSYNACLAF